MASIVGAAGLLQVVDQFFSQLDNSIRQAEMAQNRVVANAGHELRSNLEKASTDLREIMQDSLQDADRIAQQHLATFQQVVQAFNQGNMQAVTTLSRSIKTASLSIRLANPLADRTPSLESWTPRCISSEGSGSVKFTFSGLFPDAGNSGYQSTLTFNNRPFNVLPTTNMELECRLTRDQIFGPGLLTNRITYATGVISIPYPATFTRPAVVFHTTIAALPTTVGTLTWKSWETRYKDKVEEVRRNGFHLDSCGESDDWQRNEPEVCVGAGGGNTTRKDHPFNVYPDTGCTVDITRAITFDVAGHSRGTRSGPRVTATGSSVIDVRASTEYERWGSSGIMDFSVKFSQIRPNGEREDLDSGERPFSLKWGEEYTFSPPYKHWEVKFTPFDATPGSTPLSLQQVTTHEYLDIVANGGAYTVKAKKTDNIQW